MKSTENTRPKPAIIIVVALNLAEETIENTLVSVEEQSHHCHHTFVVGNAASSRTKELVGKFISDDLEFLDFGDNHGFCYANNIGLQRVVDAYKYVLLLNPDVVLPADFLASALDYLESAVGENVGAVGPKLLWYDLAANSRTTRIDSTGIFQTRVGKWYDRGQGEQDMGHYDSDGSDAVVPAICGAAMFCRTSVLKKVQLSDGEFFRNSFFMYKDDIDLSLRIAATGYLVKYNSNLVAWHCRGWKGRIAMSRRAKLISARNEFVINRHLGLVKAIYSLLKMFIAFWGI
jgi:GT2 family glycosyltransferase